MKNKNKILPISLGVVTLSLLSAICIYAWSEPVSNPPTCDSGDPGCDAPVNIGPTAQTKQGQLGINGGLDPTYGLTVASDGLKATGDSYFEGSLATVGNLQTSADLNVPSGSICLAGDCRSSWEWIEGTGNQNYVPKFTDSGTIGNSIIENIGNDVTIGGGSGELTVGTSSASTLCLSGDCKNNWGEVSGIEGGGTTNYVSKFTGSGTIGNSIIADDGSSLSIGGDVTIGGGTGKLTVGTIDPVFDIEGEKYATYGLDYAGGVRVETSGTIKLKDQFVIDFSECQKGSDLWLFWEVSNKDLEEVSVSLTPSFPGVVWYEKEGDTLTFYGEGEGEVSYRLSVPRVDYLRWDNWVEDQGVSGIRVEDY